MKSAARPRTPTFFFWLASCSEVMQKGDLRDARPAA